VQFGQFFSFFYHAGIISGNHFCTYIVAGADDFADFLVVLQHSIIARDAFLGHERRIGGHAVENAQFAGFLDVVEVGSIYKK